MLQIASKQWNCKFLRQQHLFLNVFSSNMISHIFSPICLIPQTLNRNSLFCWLQSYGITNYTFTNYLGIRGAEGAPLPALCFAQLALAFSYYTIFTMKRVTYTQIYTWTYILKYELTPTKIEITNMWNNLTLPFIENKGLYKGAKLCIWFSYFYFFCRFNHNHKGSHQKKK